MTVETIKSNEDTNKVFIGIKPFINYVMSVVMQFKKSNEVVISARGKFISKACDVVEVAKRTFLKENNITTKNIKVSSEMFLNKENNKEIWVSTIDIILEKRDLK